ncbi:MAG: MarR family transcriptional regulator [Firmicutes bacterium HGW-Firmicutes-1]|jgi:DNA-binding MarR family transcriptional regulator|nr:MAG: MarR family transcriptional regulator [Firmicutes bacterium HGW-Firmicutes-1]
MKNKLSYGESTDINLKALVTLTRGTQTVRRKEMHTVKAGGLTASQFGVLEVLYHKGDLRINEIIEKMLSTGGNMTVVIDNLEKDGFISRYPAPDDRRSTIVSITNKGTTLFETVFPDHIENINKIFNVLTTEEKQSLINIMKKLGGVS